METNLTVRPATRDDYDEILATYAFAREIMRTSGNPTQWGTTHPPISMIEEDLRLHQNYVVMDGDTLCGVFAFLMGPDPCYGYIEGGKWPNDKPYGVIHRIAGNGKRKGVLHAAVEYGFTVIPTLRIDTHKDNVIMQHLLEKEKFEACGIVYMEDNTPRIAYQKEI